MHDNVLMLVKTLIGCDFIKYLKENFGDIFIGGFGLYALFEVIMGLMNGRITLSQPGGGKSIIFKLP